MSEMLAVTDEQVRDMLREAAAGYAIKRKNSNGIRLWAAAHGVLSSRACEVLSGKRAPNDEVLAALGLERRIVRTLNTNLGEQG